MDWLDDRSKTLAWFMSITNKSLVLLTILGKKPGIAGVNQISPSVALILMFNSVLCNLIRGLQNPNRKLAIRTNQVSNGRKMTLDLEIISWIAVVSFLRARICAALRNTAEQKPTKSSLAPEHAITRQPRATPSVRTRQVPHCLRYPQ